MKHIINHFNLLYTCHYILCVSVRDTICPSTGHFVPPRDFYREINFHEHMLTLLIRRMFSIIRTQHMLTLLINALKKCSLGECFLTITKSTITNSSSSCRASVIHSCLQVSIKQLSDRSEYNATVNLYSPNV